jgi:hypothetical protein
MLNASISNMFKIRINDRYDLRSNNNNYDLGNPFGMTYQLQQKKKALALTNLHLIQFGKYLNRNRIYSETNVVHAIIKFVMFSLFLCIYLLLYL